MHQGDLVRPESLNLLEAVRIDRYQDLPEEVREWVVRQDIPSKLLAQLKGHLHKDMTVGEAFLAIRKALSAIYAAEGEHKATSFEESRFSDLEHVIRLGLSSCGAKTTVYGAVLRAMGIPVKYVHGWFVDRPRNTSGDRHAWLKIYNPVTKTWDARDPTTADFSLNTGMQELKDYHSWDELHHDYEKGEW